MTSALLVRLPVRPGRADEVASLVVAHGLEHADDGVAALLPGDGIPTATTFLERGESGPALWWYVERTGPAADDWADPAEAIRRSPLFGAGLDALLDPDASPRVFRRDRVGSRLIVHARHPDRPATYRTGADGVARPDGAWTPAVVLADDGPAAVPDVVLVRWRLRPGPATWLVRWFARITNWVDEEGRIERTFARWSEPALEEEAMWTETGFLERGRPAGASAGHGPAASGRYESGAAVLWVMETAEMAGVFEGFEATDNLVARVAEHVLGWVIEEPARALQYEAMRTDFEPLVHAVDPDRG